MTPLPCPFCGKKPVFGRTKKTSCQLHGEPIQYVTLGCANRDCFISNSVCIGGDIYNEPVEAANAQAVSQWNKREAA